MKKKVEKIIIGVLILIATTMYSYVDKTSYIYNKNIDPSEYSNTEVLVNKGIEQEFISDEGELDGISLKCATIGDIKGVDLEYKIVRVSTGQKAEGSVKASDISNSKFHKFRFEKFEKCKGEKFIFSVKEINSSNENGVSFYYQRSKIDSGEFYIDSEAIKGTLIMRTISHKFDIETFVIVLAIIIYVSAFLKILYKLFR